MTSSFAGELNINKKKKHGGAGRGQGRKPIKTGEETISLSIRMTVSQRNKLGLLGGSQWIRKCIDEAESSSDPT